MNVENLVEVLSKEKHIAKKHAESLLASLDDQEIEEMEKQEQEYFKEESNEKEEQFTQ